MGQPWHAWSSLGRPPGGFVLHRIALAENGDGRLEVLAVGTDGSLWQIWQTTPNNGWSHWDTRGRPSVDGIELTSPAVGKSLAVDRTPSGRLVACAVSARQAWVIHQTEAGNGWGKWERLGQPGHAGVSALDLISNADGRLQLFAISRGRMACRDQTGPDGSWNEWNTEFPSDDDLPVASFACGANKDGRLELLVSLGGSILGLVTQQVPGGRFLPGFGNAGVSSPGGDPSGGGLGTLSMARSSDGTLQAATTVRGRLIVIRQRVPDQLPSPGGRGWDRQNLDLPDSVVAVRLPVLSTRRDGSLDVLVVGSDGNLWRRGQMSATSGWSTWQKLGSPSPNGGGVTGLDVGENQDGHLEAFVVYQGQLWHTWEMR